MGLPNAKRVSDDFAIDSGPGTRHPASASPSTIDQENIECESASSLRPSAWRSPKAATRIARYPTGYSSDLLSDVMANAKADGVLVTVQAHKNAVAVASLVGPRRDHRLQLQAPARGHGRGRARRGRCGIPKPENAFEVSGRLWALLHRP